MRKIYVSDYTLKHLNKERKNPLLFREKVAIATSIDAVGVDTIELAPVANFKEDKIICKTIAKAIKRSAVAIPVGYTEKSVEEAWECIKAAEKPILQVELPLSTVQMEYIFHFKAAKMLPLVEKLVKAAKEKCDRVEFVAVDCTRAEPQVLADAIRIAIENGATAITLSDDAGTMFPVEFAQFVKTVKDKVSVPVYVKVSGELFMKTSTAFESLKSGADGIKSVMQGSMQLKTGKISQVIASKGEMYGFCTYINTTRIYSDSKAMGDELGITEKEVPVQQGENDNILLDNDSTIDMVSDAAEKLGYTLTEEDAGNVLQGLKRVTEKRGSIGARELDALIAAYAMQAPATFSLESYTATSSNLTSAMAHIVMTKNGDKKVSGTGVGDGPIDAAFSAIEQGTGYHYELEDFQINTITEGKESLGYAIIKLRNNGKLYSGNGISTDIVGACIRAYINALNKIVYDED